jgi:hypothetical protein
VEYDPDAIASSGKTVRPRAETLIATREALISQSDWTAEPLEVALRGLAETRGVTTARSFNHCASRSRA